MNLLRFEQIRKATQDYDKSIDRATCSVRLANVFSMLQECVDELGQRFKPTPARTSGPRPVLFDQQGNPIMPPPMVQQFEGERRAQYALDRHMAVMLLDPDGWRVFALRWGLVPPPGGWDNTEAIINVMHAVRLGVRSVPYVDKHFSAVHLTSRGIALPKPMRLVNGELVGHDTDPTLPTTT